MLASSITPEQKLKNAQSKVIVGMSGGVDSSVAAWLLQQQGYQVEGLFMKNWDEDDGTDYCTAIEDLADAQQVSDRLSMTLHQANFATEYWDNVFEHFIEEYKAARTPNPDILCNREIKFKAFLEYAEQLGSDYIATGHYAQISANQNGVELHKGLDDNKDQSYFLHAVEQGAFAKTLFPLGGINKDVVRQIAQEQGFLNHDKRDSTGICFIGERRFKDFLQTYIPTKPGKIKTQDGQIIGEHQGLMYHTIGQRQGLHIGGIKDTGELPWYVIAKNVADNSLVVAQGTNHKALMSQALSCSSIHLINQEIELDGLNCWAKTRYRQPDQACIVHKIKQAWRIEFELPQRAVTPGQSLVLYNKTHCLGGGVIESTEQCN